MKFLRTLLKLAAIAAVIAAIRQEMSKPREEREWHGRVAGIVPYEFRPPTPQRILDSLWNPGDSRVFTEIAFGVGWGINLARVRELVGGVAA